MSSDHEAEIRASVGAHYDLGSRYDDAVAEGLVERIGAEIDKRIDARLGLLGARAGSSSGSQVAPGVPGSRAVPDAPPGATVPLWPAGPPGAAIPAEAAMPAGFPVPPGPAAPPGYQGYQVPPGYQGYQVPPGYPPADYQGYPGYPGHPSYQGYQGPVSPPGYQFPAPGAAPPPVSHAQRSVAFTVTALGSTALGVLATAVVSRAPTPGGAQAIMVLLIWTAIAVINIAYARRR